MATLAQNLLCFSMMMLLLTQHRQTSTSIAAMKAYIPLGNFLEIKYLL